MKKLILIKSPQMIKKSLKNIQCAKIIENICYINACQIQMYQAVHKIKNKNRETSKSKRKIK